MTEKELRKIFKNWVPPRYLNQKQVCAYTGRSPTTIKEWVDQGLPQIIFSETSRPQYDTRDVDEWMAKHKMGINV